LSKEAQPSSEDQTVQ